MVNARNAYSSQKANAKRRGIGWELTFEQWLTWWGEDLKNRGVGHDKLQMQRFADTGPYRLDNIRKGFPVRNSKTAADMKRKRNAEHAKLLREALLDAAMYQAPDEDKEELTEDEFELRKLGYHGSVRMRYNHRA